MDDAKILCRCVEVHELIFSGRKYYNQNFCGINKKIFLIDDLYTEKEEKDTLRGPLNVTT